MTFEPIRLRRICWVAAVVVLIVFGIITVLLPDGSSEGQPVTIGDQISFFIIGMMLAAALIAFTRFRVRADQQGIWVRNVFGDRFFPWGVVVSVELPESASWAHLELHDDETIALMALQSNDGDATVDAVLSLRKLLQTAST